MKLKIKKLHKDAKTPLYAHDGDAGLDLFCVEKFILTPGERRGIKTGVALEIPAGYVGLIWERSGLAFKDGIKTYGGVIDATYRGEIIVGLMNVSDSERSFAVGDKITQIIIQKFEPVLVEEVANFEDTERGNNGFGSTGTS